MSDETNESVVGELKKHKKKGFLVVLLCVLACEIPVLLALAGFSGLTTAGALGSLPPAVAQISLTLGILGTLLLSVFIVYRVMGRTES